MTASNNWQKSPYSFWKNQISFLSSKYKVAYYPPNTPHLLKEEDKNFDKILHIYILYKNI